MRSIGNQHGWQFISFDNIYLSFYLGMTDYKMNQIHDELYALIKEGYINIVENKWIKLTIKGLFVYWKFCRQIQEFCVVCDES